MKKGGPIRFFPNLYDFRQCVEEDTVYSIASSDYDEFLSYMIDEETLA